MTLKASVRCGTIVTTGTFIWFLASMLADVSLHVRIVQRVIEASVAAVAERKVRAWHMRAILAMIHNMRFFIGENSLTVDATYNTACQGMKKIVQL